MGLTKWMEERRKRQEEQKRRMKELEPKLREARFQGYQEAKIKQAKAEGRKRATQGLGLGRVVSALGNIGEGTGRMEKTFFPEFSGMDPFGFGPRKQKKKKKGKGSGKTITIHVK